MRQLLFSADGRMSRGLFWKAVVYQLIGFCLAGLAFFLLTKVIPGEATKDGSFRVDGPAALPFVAIVFGILILAVWSQICIGIKRFHDRDKPGIWILIQFVPIIGPIWYFVEVGFLSGTIGANRYGASPVNRLGAA